MSVAVFQYPGGKARLAGWIAGLLPPPGSYAVFADVFGGAANVLLEVMRRNEKAGVKSTLYVYNDADEELVNFFRVIREPSLRERLREMLRWTPFSRKQFQECVRMVSSDPVERAWRFFTLSEQGYSGNVTGCQAGRWGCHLRDNSNIRRWLNAQERLEAFGELFRRVQVECLDFADVLRRYAGKDVLVYCDPPYYPEARADNNLYRLEMCRDRHKELADLLNAFPGMAAVSGYRCEAYDAWYATWERCDRDVACHMSNVGGVRLKGSAKPRRVESLWLNPAAVKTRGFRQARLWEDDGR